MFQRLVEGAYNCYLVVKFWLPTIQIIADIALFGSCCVIVISVWFFSLLRQDAGSQISSRKELLRPMFRGALLVALVLAGLAYFLQAISLLYPIDKIGTLAKEIKILVKAGAATATVVVACLIIPIRQKLERLEIERSRLESKEAERARQLMASKARFETLVLASAEVVWTADASGQVIEASPSWTVFTGQSDEEQLGEGWLDAIHPDDRERVRMRWWDAVKSREMFEAEYRVWRVTGEWRWMASRAAPPLTELGTVREWVGMNTDITERKKAEEAIHLQADQYSTILTATSDGYWLVDWDGTFKDVNDSYCRMSGYTHEEILSMNISEIDCSIDEEAVRNYVSQIMENGFVNFETMHKKKGGEFIYVEVNAVYWKPTNQLVLFIRDISERKQAELALRASEEKLREAQEIGELGSWELDLETNRLHWSDEQSRLFGRDPALAHPTFEQALDYVHPDDRGMVSKLYDNLLEGNEYFRSEYRIIRADGEERILDARGRRYDDANGKPVRLAGVIHDITERKRAEEQLAAAAIYTRSLFETSLDLLVTAGVDGAIIDINQAGERILGRKREKLIGTQFSSYITEPDKIQAAVAEVVSSGSIKDVLVTVAQPSGEVIQLLCNATLFHNPNGAVGGAFAAGRDITQLKRVQDELRRHQEHLEELVEQRTRELARTNDKLSAANKEMEAFSYSVSHDLRVPLRAVDGFSRILMEDYGDRFDEDGARVINIIRENTVRMGILIDDILSFSRVSRAEMVMSEIDTSAIVRAVLRAIEPSVKERKLTFDVGSLPHILGDANTLQRVWSNLIENAVKYSSKKEEARIEIGSRAGQGETIFYVKDNGAGFDMAQADRLFGVFQRLHGSEFGGTGIGLAIVKRIIDRHGGRIWAEGRVGEGATFYFSLPAMESKVART